LTVIEPPFFGLAATDLAVVAIRQRLTRLFPAPADMTPERWVAAFVQGIGSHAPDELPVAPEDVADVRASMSERPPWEATVDLAAIRSAGVPVLVIRGDWSSDLPAAAIGGAAFRAVADALVSGLDADSLVAPGATHQPQIQRADMVVPRVRAFLDTAEAAGGRARDRGRS